MNHDPNAVEPSEKTTQLPWKSSTGSWTPEHPHRPTSTSLDAYGARRDYHFQKATPDEFGRTTPPRMTHERYPTSKSLPSQPPCVDVSSEGEVAPFARSEQERLLELEQQLSATLAAQSERDHRLAQLTDEFAWKSALLERAEAIAVEATKRAGLEPREQVDRLLAQTSPRAEHADAELVEMQAKLDELELSRDQHVHALEQQIGQYETKLAEVHAELEASKFELEAVRFQHMDGKNRCAKSKAEADTLPSMTMSGLASTDEDQITRVLVERIRAMEAEIASLRWSEKDWDDMPTRNER